MLERTGHPPRHLFAAAVAFLLPVAFSPSVHSHWWAPKFAVLAVVALAGIPFLAGALRTPGLRAPAVAAAALLLVAGISALLSGDLIHSVFGLYTLGTGLLFIVGLAGAWALGASVADDGARLVGTALIVSAVVNVLVAALQVLVDLSTFSLPSAARVGALEGNPVHLGALAAATVALLAGRLPRRPFLYSGGIVLLGAGVQLAGSRFALLVLLAVGAVACVSLAGWKPRTAVVAAVVAGVAAGGWLANVGGESTGVGRSGTATARVAEGASTSVTVRLAVWGTAVEAFADHPLVGNGPGRFRDATSKYRTLELAREDTTQEVYGDAHNIVVEYATTTGALGLLALSVWIASVVWLASGPMLLFGLGLLVLHFVQPQWPGTTPLLFLALGVASRRPFSPSWAPVPGAVAGAIIGVVVLLGAWSLQQAHLDFSLSHARQAERLLPDWPVTQTMLGTIRTFRYLNTRDPVELERATTHWENAVARDPSNPTLWNNLAGLEAQHGNRRLAEQYFLQALERDPYSDRAAGALGRLYYERGEYEEAVEYLELAIRIRPTEGREELVSRARARARSHSD